jgi:hypothetical protein
MLPELNQEQVIQRGLAARLLLADPTFNSFFDETRDLTLVAMGNTQPHEKDEREALYLRYTALNDLIGTMQSYASAADEILKLRDIETDS